MTTFSQNCQKWQKGGELTTVAEHQISPIELFELKSRLTRLAWNEIPGKRRLSVLCCSRQV
jgi:hypothetical protein